MRPSFATQKSHINLIAADTGSWEHAPALARDASDLVFAYARNEPLEFSIPYELLGIPHWYYPDFLVRLVDASTLILEIKGREIVEDRAKYAAADRWVSAVNNWGKLGRWRRWVWKELMRLQEELAMLVEDELVIAGGDGTARAFG